MKVFAYRALLILICIAAGFAIGRLTAPKADLTHLYAVGVDCYDSQGRLVEDTWGKKFGAVTVSCAPGQTAKLHQAAAH